MPITQEEYQILDAELRAGGLQGENAQYAAQLMAEFENANQEEEETPSWTPFATKGIPQGQTAEEQQSQAIQQEAAGLSAMGGVQQAVSGMAQAVLDGVAGLTGSETVARWAEEEQAAGEELANSTQKLVSGYTRNVFGYDPDPQELEEFVTKHMEGGQLIGKMGLGMAGGLGTAKLAKPLLNTGMRVMGFSAADGALWAYLSGDSEAASAAARANERLGDVPVGLVLGAAGGSIPAIQAGFKNFMGRKFGAHSPEALAAIRRSEEADVAITQGMATGDPELLKIEADAMGPYAQKFLAQKGEEVYTSLAQHLGVEAPDIAELGIGHADRIAKLLDKFDVSVAKMKATTNREWDSARKLAIETGGNAKIMTPNSTVDRLRGVVEDLATSHNIDITEHISKEYSSVLREMMQSRAQGGATAPQLDRWWKVFNRWKDSDAGIIDPGSPFSKTATDQQKKLAGTLVSSLKDDIDAAQRMAPGTVADDTLSILKAGREAYSNGRRAIQTYTEQLRSAFGTKAMAPDEFANKLAKADPAVIRRATESLRRLDGGQEIIDDMLGLGFEASVLKGTQRIGPMMAGDLNVADFANAFAANTRRSALSGLLTPEQETRALEGLKLMRNVLNGMEQAKGQVVRKTTLPMTFQDMSINLFSRDPGFMARLAAGAITRGKGADKFFHSDEGINYLRALQPKNVRDLGKWGIARNGATIGLLQMLQTGSLEGAIKNE
jgi:hypothetical protein